ncbi:MAG TPA: TetR family transcriptional regulator [Nocardioides sp.]|uniref:TetR/AcrR family transcriptional regulator n=1 Tax=Nocardioides sp. TaxID=35761 RepID=UPI002E30A020|nr:TetR family transcriptional regulator [Nocardioides sp.]HEX5086275.1 TetR family transcriptional regulator [Nocardioides sp.]
MATTDDGLRKSDRTRAAILAAARRQFGEHAYDQTSLRAIAADAGIDPALIVRYFTNKETLFAAAVDVDLRLPDFREIPVRSRGEALARHFLDQWEGEDRNEALPVIVRSAVAHEIAADHVRQVFASQVRRAIARASGANGARTRAGLVSSQLLGLAIARYMIKLPGVADLSRDDVVRHVGPTLQRYLTADLGDKSAPRRTT